MGEPVIFLNLLFNTGQPVQERQLKSWGRRTARGSSQNRLMSKESVSTDSYNFKLLYMWREELKRVLSNGKKLASTQIECGTFCQTFNKLK